MQEEVLIAPRVTNDSIMKKMKYVEFVKQVTKGNKILRWCVITMENGFAITGNPSASVSPENDNQEIGEKIAYSNAYNEIAMLEGYLLAEQLYHIHKIDKYKFSLQFKNEEYLDDFLLRDFMSEVYVSKYNNGYKRVYFNIDDIQSYCEYLENDYNY